MPRRNHQTESFDKPNRAFARGKGYAVIGADSVGQPKVLESPLKNRKGKSLSAWTSDPRRSAGSAIDSR